MTLLQLARVGGMTSTKALSQWDDTRLTAHITFSPTELTVSFINLSSEPVNIYDSGVVFGRRRPPQELVLARRADDRTGPSVAAGDAVVCARVPIEVVRSMVSRFRLKPSRMRGRVTLEDGRVILSKCLRIKKSD